MASYIWFRGRRMTPAVKGALLAAEKRAGRQFTITQGGFNGTAVAASAGTHAGDALDFSVRNLSYTTVSKMIDSLRWAGFAAWFRTTRYAKWGTRAQGFGSYHVHAVPNGWGRPSYGARQQAVAYRNGRDGLARNLADLGPGHTGAYRKQTWPRTTASITTASTTTAARPGLPESGVDDRTPLERLLDNMDIKDLEALIYKTVNKVLTDKEGRVGALNYEKSKEAAIAAFNTPAIKGSENEWGQTPKDLIPRTAYRVEHYGKAASAKLDQILNKLEG